MQSSNLGSILFGAVLWAAALAPSASAQDEFFHLAPTKDVAMLVDISVSVRDDRVGHEGAQAIIQDILSGKPFAMTGWTVDPGDGAMRDLFARYLGLPGSASSPPAELRPLMAPGGSFLSLPVGELTTVLNGEITRKLRGVEGIRDLVSEGYPRQKQMVDTSTCYWFAMAQAADTLSQRSRLGYYLFVVSDEEDDPDYREDGPPGHTARDYVRYKKELASRYPVEAIRAAIGKYFVPAGMSSNKVEQYNPRGDFQQLKIASFYQNRGLKKVRLSWYAMGVAPEKVLVPRRPPPLVVPVGQVAPPPPVAYEAPKPTPYLQLLGGLEGGSKRFGYARPILVWQIANLESSGWDPGGKPSLEIAGAVSKRITPLGNSPRKVIKSWQAPDGLGNDSHLVKLELRDGGRESDDGLLDREINFIKSAGSPWWLTIFAIVSTVAAVVIFFFAWRSLREKRLPPQTSPM